MNKAILAPIMSGEGDPTWKDFTFYQSFITKNDMPAAITDFAQQKQREQTEQKYAEIQKCVTKILDEFSQSIKNNEGN